MGGIAFGEVVGYLLDHGVGYKPRFFAPAGNAAHHRVSDHSYAIPVLATELAPQLKLRGSFMKITEIRTRVVRWRGKTVPLPPHFCTNPMDLLELPEASMRTFTFHGWLIVEVFHG